MSKSSTFLCKKRAALQWIENVLDIKIDQNKEFNQIFEDGVLLCKVINTISPRLMPRISIPDANTPKATIRFKYNENISFFIQACVDMGVPRHKRFALSDIVNNHTTYQNIKRIIECLESVCKIANSDPNYEFSIEWPQLEPTIEEFSKDEINHAESLLAQFTIRENKRQEVIKKSQSQNEGNSVEATKNQLFQHLAAQKQLYPDNSPQQRSPKSDRNSLSQPVSPLITNVKGTITPDSVSLSSSPNVKPVPSSPSKPSVVVSTATVATNASSTGTVVSSASNTTTTSTTIPPVASSTSTPASNNGTPSRQSISRPQLSLEERAAIRIQKATRRWLERNRQIILARDSAYRERIVQEIKKTEVEYINRLAYLNDVILKDLREAIDKGSPIITIEEIQSIFSEVQIILSYNKRLLSDIEGRTKEWKQDTMIGDIFIKFSNFLKIYSQYSRSYSEAMGVLNECKKQSKFKSYLNKIKEQNEEIKLRGLEDYLIRPIQRIPRYSLLIKDMISHTWQTHPDYEQLKQAFDKINLVAENMNEMRKEAESIMKLAEIQEKLDGDNQLAKSHRRFVKEGEFFEILNKGKKTPIVLYLFNDSLAITRPNKSSGSSFFGKQKTIRLQFEQIIFLHQLVIKEFEGSNNLQIFKEKSFSMLITAPDKETLTEWIKAINIEKTEYQKTLSDHNDRQMVHVIERAEHTKQKIEEKFTGRASGQFTTNEIESQISSGAPSSDDLSSSGSSIDMKSGKMSLRERRLKLAQESKSKRLSGSSSSFTNLNDQNLKDSK
ncbi:hypothetical protein DICPUDRAFT_99548 [Dictyostelium purpureum]|uniref:Pleckstrin domain-containing protein n=1 Tax=Dictyostelium purpureum TaxID=5786 RepID=F1A076_DICPU|nr:uncharacterized protein DICPUDRAFT_99548 [Dictyostelium purpureum]EGC30399.1 hypothetical protein DICPUDRAFT_99548 [Dictyostelium purpureum]|eukprot:XP_003293067.1 hypothetical protein DICPUDRAFT_99548 [Dictyostelium purpureum]